MQEKTQFDWRLKLGLAIFSLSIILPLAGMPLVVFMNLSTTMTTTVSGALLVAAELLGVAAVAVMGKEGYLFIKERLFGFLKQYGPADKVGKRRYRIGLVMFCLPLLFGWISPYLIPHIMDQGQLPLAYAILGDILFLTSLFVLGGDFWDKIRALFDQNVNICHSSGNDTE
jgi:hypothetical protein